MFYKCHQFLKYFVIISDIHWRLLFGGIFRDLISKALFEKKSSKLILWFQYTIILGSSVASKLLKSILILWLGILVFQTHLKFIFNNGNFGVNLKYFQALNLSGSYQGKLCPYPLAILNLGNLLYLSIRYLRDLNFSWITKSKKIIGAMILSGREM